MLICLFFDLRFMMLTARFQVLYEAMVNIIILRNGSGKTLKEVEVRRIQANEL